ncbi:xylulokinase [Marinivivus vitaminiproducens]|uniref:xylulokinase n=1 Tax=Marinivivus vitaminiproducens TaxID=3035935 RepID=UPI0027A378D8|nr:xylulokinase [Geminicoccaceae bacterium SCSIO 64248]
MFIGIDLGTSSVKSILVDGGQRLLASATCPLEVQRPAPGHSEQDPEAWWQAVLTTLDALRADQRTAFETTEGIGLSGQMHGAVVLDGKGQVLRPCILWDDVRSTAECVAFEEAFPDSRQVTGNLAMPGFTAPKLLWLRNHEPAVFERTAKVVLPKAYVRFRLTGLLIEDMSDASGTLWLDTGARRWSAPALAATGLGEEAMPDLVEGNASAGQMTDDLVRRFGFRRAPVVAGGAGDNAAGAIGLGAISAGRAFVSLGTSGVLWATTDRFVPYPEAAVHAFCHAVPATWHQMGVTLSAAAALGWWAKVAGASEADLAGALADPPKAPSPATFLPYLAGERTPHNDGAIRGAFADLSYGADRDALTQAVLEGVAFSFRDCLDALAKSGTTIDEADVIGGGSRARVWIGILASVLGVTLHRLADGEHGPAFGAARLARLAVTGEAPEDVCAPPRRIEAIAPVPALVDAYAGRFERYRALYPALRP